MELLLIPLVLAIVVIVLCIRAIRRASPAQREEWMTPVHTPEADAVADAAGREAAAFLIAGPAGNYLLWKHRRRQRKVGRKQQQKDAA